MFWLGFGLGIIACFFIIFFFCAVQLDSDDDLNRK